MADILIRVPDSIRCCGECPCFYAEHPMRCQADTHRPKRTHGAPYAGKPDWCPAKELPPHGDLIDLSAKVDCQYYDEMYEEWSIRTVTVEDVLRGCLEKMPPVIVPASRQAEGFDGNNQTL